MTARRRPFGERASDALTASLRSWYALALFAVWTAWWWAGGGAAVAHDAYPFVFWNVIVSAVTLVDIIVYGIRQVRQDRELAAVAAAQLQGTQSLTVHMAAVERLLLAAEEETRRKVVG